MNKEETDLIIAEQNKSTEEILKAIEQEKCELLGIIQGKDKAIKDLEKENRDLRDNYDQFKAVAVPEIERLQKENAELKHNKKTVVHLADCLEEKMKKRLKNLKQDVQNCFCKTMSLQNDLKNQ